MCVCRNSIIVTDADYNVDYRDIIIFHLSIYDLQGCMNLIGFNIWLLLPTVVCSLVSACASYSLLLYLGNTRLL